MSWGRCCEARRKVRRQNVFIMYLPGKESVQGRTVDALAHGGDEGRDKLRKSRVRRKWPLTPGCPNGKTRRFGGPASPR